MGNFTSDPDTGLFVYSKAPSEDYITDYDRKHLATYLSLLYGAGEGHSEEKMALDILGIDAAVEPARARRTLRSHLSRARWLATNGYKHLLKNRPPEEISTT